MYTCGNSMQSCIVANRAKKHDDRKHFREGEEKRPSTVGDTEWLMGVTRVNDPSGGNA